MTSFRFPGACVTAALVLLAATAPVAAAVPARKSGTAEITLTGAKKASGTFPAICGPYFMMDAPGIAKAGDGLVLNTSTASYVGDARGANRIVFGPKLDKATVRATVKNLRMRRGSAPDVITIEAELDCGK